MFAVGQSLHRSVCRTRMPASSPGLNDSNWTFCHWISAAYEVLSAAARDEPWNQSALDRVFEAYSGERTVSGLRSRISTASASFTGLSGYRS